MCIKQTQIESVFFVLLRNYCDKLYIDTRMDDIMLQVSQVKVQLNNDDDLKNIIAKKLRISVDQILSYTIHRRSLDARRKHDMSFVYSFLVEVRNESKVLSKNINNVSSHVNDNSVMDFLNKEYSDSPKIAIIGFGPAGMFAALTFARAGINVTVYERGEEVDNRIKSIEEFKVNRVLNPNSNIQFGEGGAGTFSDGKLTNRKKDPLGKWLFEELVKAGAPEEILYVHNPHIGTDKLVHMVKNIRKEIISLGSKVLFNSTVTDIEKKEDGLHITVDGETLKFNDVVLAIGHSSRDTIEMLYRNQCDIIQKPFAVGMRIEHKQTLINKAQYGENHSHPKLGSAEYKLTHQTKSGKGVYTFCMCPGGLVVPSSSEEGMLVVNGMSEYKRDKVNANSALLVTVDEKDFQSSHPLAGVEFQRKLERRSFELGGSNYNAPVQRVVDYMNNVETSQLGDVLPSYSIGVKYANLRVLFSDSINQAFIEAIPKMGQKLKGFDSSDALFTGVESRSSSPVRIVRDKSSMQSTNFSGLYPTGEGAGYAGGIVSAAIDGIRVAKTILEKYVK